MHLFWLSWELWTLNKSKCCPPLPSSISYSEVLRSPTPRPCFWSVSAVTNAQTARVHKESAALLQERDGSWVYFTVRCTHLVPFNKCVVAGCFQPGTWLSPKFQLAQRKQASPRSKTGGFVAQTYRTEQLSIATRDGEGNRRRTVALCDPCGGRCSSATFLWQNTVNSPPCRQVSL